MRERGEEVILNQHIITTDGRFLALAGQKGTVLAEAGYNLYTVRMLRENGPILHIYEYQLEPKT